MAVKQLSDGSTDGVRLGQSSTDLVAFYGGTPVVKQTVTGTVTTTAPVLGATAAYGFSTTAQFNAVVSAVAAMQAMGLI